MTSRQSITGADADALRALFERDPQAMLAAVRDAGETGKEPSARIRAAMATAAPAIRRAAKTEVAAALLDLLVTPHPIVALEALAATGLMELLLPEVETLRRMPPAQRHKDIYRHTLLVVARSAPDPISRLAALLHDIGKPATRVIERGAVHFPGHAELGADMARRRLRTLGFDRATVEAVTLLVALHLRINSYEDEWTDSAARRLAREAGDQFERLLDLSRADVTSARRELVERALRRVDALAARIAALRAAEEKPESPLDGTELMEMFGRPPGRWIGTVKAHLAALVGSGDLAPDDKERAAEIARRLLEDTREDVRV
jgi:poly(A) polymerase